MGGQNRSRISAERARSRFRFVAGLALAALAAVGLLRDTSPPMWPLDQVAAAYLAKTQK